MQKALKKYIVIILFMKHFYKVLCEISKKYFLCFILLCKTDKDRKKNRFKNTKNLYEIDRDETIIIKGREKTCHI